MLITGDLHYTNPNSLNINIHRNPYTVALKQPSISTLLSHVPVTYMWDDHDYACNDCDGTAIGKHSAFVSYKQIVPHYPLQDTAIDTAIYQSFDYGRLHFIMSDLRSERLIGSHIMSATQMQWLKSEFLKSKANNQLAVWISSVSFNGVNQLDNWAAYDSERVDLSNFWRDSAIANVLILSGDAHMIAYDNGTNNHYTSGTINTNQYPIFQAAALNAAGSFKGGPYSGGWYLNPAIYIGQFGTVDVQDNGGDSICIQLKAFRSDSASSHISQLVTYNFCRTLIPDSVFTNINLPFKSLFYAYTENDELVITGRLLDSSSTIEIVNEKGQKIYESFILNRNESKRIKLKSQHGIAIIKAVAPKNVETRKVAY
jgi:hypothetical protein